MKVLIVGADLTSNGGIASVVKSYYEAYRKGNYDFELKLLKTTYYKDKTTFSNLLKFVQAVFIFLHASFTIRYDIIHIHTSAGRSFYRKSVFVLLSKLLKCKVILHLHSSDFYDFFLKKTSFKRFIFDNCESIVVLCKDWEEKIKSLYPNLNIIKIENPYNVAEYNEPENFVKHAKTSSKFIVLFVGFLIESKGIRDLIELAELFKKNSISNILIKIAGKGPLENYLIESIKVKGLTSHLEYIGWVDGDSKRQNYESASAFILPSYKEGMPISILEAMSFGLPVISTSIAGIPDVISNEVNGFLTEPGNVVDYYTYLCRLSNNPELAQNISTNAYLRVSQNTKEVIFNQVVGLYYSIS